MMLMHLNVININRIPKLPIILLLFIIGCAGKKQDEAINEPVIDDIMLSVSETEAYRDLGFLRLSDYGFFKLPIKELNPVDSMLPYDLNSPLFTDYASKKRFIYVPEGKKIEYKTREMLGFPVGTILIKNFFYKEEQLSGSEEVIVETRLLINKADGWIALPYIWNADQTEAFLEITGGSVPIQLASYEKPFEYNIPTMIECKSCHETNGIFAPLGPNARQLNKPFDYEDGTSNQLRKIIDKGWLINYPAQTEWPIIARWEDETANLSDRARAYLDINCGHCHRAEGPAKNSGLDLTLFSRNDLTLGINKSPVAAGKGSGDLNYDIVPGNPENSIIVYRMNSTDPGEMMPELGRSLVHKEGIGLISDWIRSL